ncbi:3-dehydroshikimate dehydratase [Paenibacillus endophyticus]|uniref:3-dehydroshikimate dehydratase n=1 Tax=Paenibacillus endophyticus TaxID=1294268 RepID=A0A7W5CC04_9BACL|nr:sugar phosphate isomerase/epimerase family protein [Paenibacillus endophyticus]MBB3154921.1 3-dehydroshikimate dehydratase [Paenibacillus endophyticus]
MKIALCTISFRHQLISMNELIAFAAAHGFNGIELWGTHARSMYEAKGSYGQMEDPRAQLAKNGLEVSMLSDYLNIALDVDYSRIEKQAKQVISLADWFNVSRIRTFAGERPSGEVGMAEWTQYLDRLRFIGDLCARASKKLLLETHPNTLADRLDSTLRLMEELDHPAIGLNLDVFHLWESGADPLASMSLLNPWVDYYHLKNSASLQQAKLFEPHNVYSPSGDRRGMVPLCEGAIDYRPVLEQIKRDAIGAQSGRFVSLEWFGTNSQAVLAQDIAFIRKAHAAQPIG